MIAPAKLECLFLSSKLLQQVFLHGDSNQDYIVAVVVPDEFEVTRWT